MNCHDFELIVLRLARNQLLEAAIRNRACIHAESCVSCAARLDEERALLVWMRVLTAEIAKEEAPARLEAELLGAFREQTAVAPAQSTGAPPAKSSHPLRRGLAAAAAVILISITAAAILLHKSGSQERRQVTQAVTDVPSVPINRPLESMSPQLNPVIKDARKLARVRVTTGRRRLTPRQSGLQDSSEAELATHFYPLPNADDFNLLESGQVVRLELPGSALEEMGLPADAVAAGKTVTADVVIGPDGLGHAIRFVHQATPSNH